MMKKTLILSSLLLGAITLTGCGPQTNNEVLTGEDMLVQTWAEGSGMNPIGMANPASEYCVSQGGTSENRKDKDGAEFGVCKLANGEEREEWDFYRESQYTGHSQEDAKAKAKENKVKFRIAEQNWKAKAKENKVEFRVAEQDGEAKAIGMANPASEYCVSQGGTSENRKDKNGAEFGVCKLANGEEREEWNFYRESQYVGLSLADAKAKAKKYKVEFRIAEQDGEAKALTMDLRPGRVNAVVNSGIVTSVVIE